MDFSRRLLRLRCFRTCQDSRHSCRERNAWIIFTVSPVCWCCKGLQYCRFRATNRQWESEEHRVRKWPSSRPTKQVCIVLCGGAKHPPSAFDDCSSRSRPPCRLQRQPGGPVQQVSRKQQHFKASIARPDGSHQVQGTQTAAACRGRTERLKRQFQISMGDFRRYLTFFSSSSFQCRDDCGRLNLDSQLSKQCFTCMLAELQ